MFRISEIAAIVGLSRTALLYYEKLGIIKSIRLPNSYHFTDLNKQLQELYCNRDPSAYKNCLIQPAGQIDLNLIIREKSNLDRIVATMGLKEMT